MNMYKVTGKFIRALNQQQITSYTLHYYILLVLVMQEIYFA